jgi:SAM-dependent methyltransferase
MNCPLCDGTKTEPQASLDVKRILSHWMRDFKIDVSSEFGKVSVIELHKCGDCTIQFFKPDSLAGSPQMYMALEKQEQYYLPRKWEHEMALLDIDGSRNGVEIGCGFGSFVERVNKEKGIPFDGCEQNPSAIQVARSNGVNLLLEDSDNLAKRLPRGYDVVCCFQVLEHVSRPRDLLNSFCDLLRPGGKLLLGLPNADSFLKHQFNLLDLPPHHMTRWTSEVLSRLQAWFPLKLIRVAYEPLPDYQVDFYVNAYLDFISKWGLGIAAWPPIRWRVASVIRRPGVRRLLRGQSFYASYQRT